MKKLLPILLVILLIPIFARASVWDAIKNWWNPQPEITLGATVLFPSGGGTGTSTNPKAGQVLIGTAGGIYSPTWLAAGANVTIATSSGGIEISAIGGSGTFTTTTINGLSQTAYTFKTGGTNLAVATSGTSTITHTWTDPGYATTGALVAYLKTESDPIWQASSTGYLATFATSVFALDTDLYSYLLVSASSTFALDTDLANYMTTFATSVFALDTDLDNYMSEFATSVFALDTDLYSYLPMSASSTFLTTASSTATYLTTASSTLTYLTNASATITYLRISASTSIPGYATTGTAGLTNYFTSTYTNTNFIATNTLTSNYYTTTTIVTTYLPITASSSFVHWVSASTTNWNTAYAYVNSSSTNLNTNYAYVTASSSNWNTAYTDRLKWDGGVTGLTAATGRTSLGLGDAAVLASSTWTTPLFVSTNYTATNTITSTYLPISASSSFVWWTSASTSNWSAAYGYFSSGILPYTKGGTATSTALPIGYLWYGTGADPTIIASSTLGGGGGVTGGQVNYVPYFTSPTALATSAVTYINGTTTIGEGSTTLNVDSSGNVYFPLLASSAGTFLSVGAGGLIGTTSYAGVSSLNTLTGALSLFDTADIQWSASGTIGLKSAIANNATTGVSNLANYYSSTYIGNNYYTTSTIIATYLPISASSTFQTIASTSLNYYSRPTLTNNTITYTTTTVSTNYFATTSNASKRSATVNFLNATTTTMYAKASIKMAVAATITEIGCSTDVGTSSLLFYEAVEVTPNASSSSILENIICDSNSASSTTFVDSAIAARNIITAQVSGILNSSNTVAWITYTISP